RIDDICCTDPTATGLYALSLHDALPICRGGPAGAGGRDRGQPAARRVGAPAGPRWVVAHPAALVSGGGGAGGAPGGRARLAAAPDRKSTRLNSSHVKISYAVFCLKKKKK